VLLVARRGFSGLGVGGVALGGVHGLVVGGFVCFLVVDLVGADRGLVAEGSAVVTVFEIVALDVRGWWVAVLLGYREWGGFLGRRG
jgi:hypothetical protein